MDKWGRIELDFYGIFPLLIQPPIREGDYFGYVGTDGIVRYWDDLGSREIQPSDTSLNLFYPDIEKPPQTNDGVDYIIMSNNLMFDTFVSSEILQRAAYYPVDGLHPKEAERTALDAWIHVGLVSGQTESSNDETTEMLQISIENSFDSSVGYSLTVIGTNDGATVYDSNVPELQSIEGKTKYYSCSVVGVWHIIEMKADEIEDRFHLKSIRGQLTYAGKLA